MIGSTFFQRAKSSSIKKGMKYSHFGWIYFYVLRACCPWQGHAAHGRGMLPLAGACCPWQGHAAHGRGKPCHYYIRIRRLAKPSYSSGRACPCHVPRCHVPRCHAPRCHVPRTCYRITTICYRISTTFACFLTDPLLVLHTDSASSW